MYLYLNTAGSQIDLALIADNFQLIVSKGWHSNNDQSEKLLSYVEELLLKHNISIRQINGIFVFAGPGSYTGLRVGLSSANALAFALNVPVWPVDKNRIDEKEYLLNITLNTGSVIITPHYAKPPHITKKKRGQISI